MIPAGGHHPGDLQAMGDFICALNTIIHCRQNGMISFQLEFIQLTGLMNVVTEAQRPEILDMYEAAPSLRGCQVHLPSEKVRVDSHRELNPC